MIIMNKVIAYIVSGIIFLTSTYALAQTRPHNNPISEPIPQVTIPSPEVTVPIPPVIEMPVVSAAPLPDQGVEGKNGGSQYKNKHNKGKNKIKSKGKRNKGKHKGKNKGKKKGKHKGQNNKHSNSGDGKLKGLDQADKSAGEHGHRDKAHSKSKHGKD